MARRHGDRPRFERWCRRSAAIELLEGRQLLSLPPAIGSNTDARFPGALIAAPEPGAPAEGTNIARPLPAGDDLGFAAPLATNLQFSGEGATTAFALSETGDITGIRIESTTVVLELSLVPSNLVGAAVYRGGSTAETLNEAANSAMRVDSVTATSPAARSPAPAADSGQAPDVEPRLAEDEPALAAAVPPVLTIDRVATTVFDSVRPPANIPDAAGQVQDRSAANLALAAAGPAVVGVANGAMPIEHEAQPAAENARLDLPDALSPADFVVSYLVALQGGEAVTAGGAAYALAERGSAAVQSLLHDLLQPKRPVDDAAIGIALGGLFADAEQVGTSLVEMLSDPVRSAEFAVATGVIAAGFAGRQLQEREARERAEARQMLAARFIRGPESVRLFGPRRGSGTF